MSILSKILGDAHEKYLKGLNPLVEKINSLEQDYGKLSDNGLKEKTLTLKEGFTEYSMLPYFITE